MNPKNAVMTLPTLMSPSKTKVDPYQNAMPYVLNMTKNILPFEAPLTKPLIIPSFLAPSKLTAYLQIKAWCSLCVKS